MRALIIGHSITERHTSSLNKYLSEIGKIPVLSIQQEVEMATRIKSGDPVALKYLVSTNLKFVVSVAKKYQHRGLSLGDLINEGNLGLIKAASKFDETKGFKFISFAVWWIRQSILLAIAEQTRIVRLPLNLINSITRLNKFKSILEQQLERFPTANELSVAVSMKEHKVSDHLKQARKSLSLDEVLNHEIGTTLLDVIPVNVAGADDILNANAGIQEVGIILGILSVREREILKFYFGLNGIEPLTLDAIAILFNLSKERVRQLKDKSLKKIRMKILKKNCNN